MDATLYISYNSTIFTETDIRSLALKLQSFGNVLIHEEDDDPSRPIKPTARLILQFHEMAVRPGLIDGIISEYYDNLMRVLRSFVGQYSTGTTSVINALTIKYTDMILSIRFTEYLSMTLLPDLLRQLYEALTISPLATMSIHQILLPASMEGVDWETAHTYSLSRIKGEYSYWGIYAYDTPMLTSIYHVKTQEFIDPPTFRHRSSW